MSNLGNLYKNKVYLEVADFIGEWIINGKCTPHQKLPSVRNLASHLGVNTLTVQKAYERLKNLDIVYASGNLGMLVSENAMENILYDRRVRFVNDILPPVKAEMQLLGFDVSCFEQVEELKKIYVSKESEVK